MLRAKRVLPRDRGNPNTLGGRYGFGAAAKQVQRSSNSMRRARVDRTVPSM
jgi:hypothetical protein